MAWIRAWMDTAKTLPDGPSRDRMYEAWCSTCEPCNTLPCNTPGSSQPSSTSLDQATSFLTRGFTEPDPSTPARRDTTTTPRHQKGTRREEIDNVSGYSLSVTQ